MALARTLCWRYHRKITMSIVIFSAMYFLLSITITKRTLPGEGVQGSDIKAFQNEEGGEDPHRKNPSRKIHRIPHDPLPGEGIQGVAHGAPKGEGQKEDEFSSSSKSSSDDNPAQSEVAKPSKKLPQAIIIGVKKGGTRALLDFISLHPDVQAANHEIHFFDSNYEKGLDWYREEMPLSKSGQITIEKTPGYFITEEAPQRIHQMNKDTKLIIVLRDPVTRALSDFAQSIATGRRKEGDFDRLAIPDPKTGDVDPEFYAVMVSLYANHFERWLKYFKRSQFLFLDGDQLVKNPAPQVIRLQKFLKIDTIIDESYFIFNSTKGFYCVKKTAEGEDVRCLGDTKGRAHPQISPLVLHHLRQFFKPHNEKLYSMVGQNFHWGEEEYRR